MAVLFEVDQGLHKPFAAYDVLGIPVSVTTLETASRAIHEWANDNVGRFVCIRDVHGVMQAQENAELRQLHEDAAMVTPDGMPLVWLGKLAGHDVKRTCGPDLIDHVLMESAASGLKHYFYGGRPGIAERLKLSFTAKYPGLQIVGASAPPFRALEASELRQVADEIQQSGADVVWVGLSTPKQEFLMRELSRLLPNTLIGVGAAFDFHSGEVKRAPVWMQRSGFEWSFRLISEPTRLWRRYLILAPKFLWLVAFRSKPRHRLS
jgi:N-acetylglucosaminyldiphosphoundecaprenol N-acetyl-beta-D-mannosaminyltransferase